MRKNCPARKYNLKLNLINGYNNNLLKFDRRAYLNVDKRRMLDEINRSLLRYDIVVL